MDRFWSKVEKGPGCWEWTSQLDSRGRYGHFRLDGKVVRAHRVAYELVKGPIPVGLQIDHLCRNPRCVNPDHLEAVTAQVNTLRGTSPAAAHAAKTQCPQGHPYNDENTKWYRNRRFCRECVRAWNREYSRRRRNGG